MIDLTAKLKELKPEKKFFIGIDSDGCVFDTMEIKHKECFCPQFIKHFGLQPVSKYAREVWEFVNLYSKTRGVNRFKAVVLALDLLRQRQKVIARNVNIKCLDGVKDWIQKETKLGNPALKQEVEKNNNNDLMLILDWSLDVNHMIADFVKNVPPFPLVKECLQKISAQADALVVSQTPCETLQREWQEHNIKGYVRMIAGQELGTKTEHIALAAKTKYAPENMLMIGDSPGDHRAAKENNALFFPIIPGKEEESWKILFDEALDRFFNAQYQGEYEQNLYQEFNRNLPGEPFWND